MEELFDPAKGGILEGIIAIVSFFILLAILKAFIKVAPPDKLLVITGRKRKDNGKTFGFSVERGRSTVIPYFQSAQYLDLRVLPINVQVDGVNSANGITVGADATACVCIDDEKNSMLYSAVERLMGKDVNQLQEQVRQTLIGNFRGALNKATPLEAIGMQESHHDEQAPGTKKSEGERAQFRNALLVDINSDLASFGMKVVSVSLQKIWDSSNYIGNLAQKTLAEKRQEVEIEEARLRAIAEKAESDARRRVEIAKSKANEQIITAREKVELYKKESEASIIKAEVEANNNIEAARNNGLKRIEELNTQLKELKNQTEILIKEEAQNDAAMILSQGDKESVKIIENAKNRILSQKVEIISNAKETGCSVLFLQQQLPHLFESFKKHSSNFSVDSFVLMDNEKGFSAAVNRGPEAFTGFLGEFEKVTGLSIKSFFATSNKEVQQ
ncbi:SPFH domain-containing protein [Natronoflexus pectinivorans]|uniref:SPFH domain/Band 7 family protein n=1 Tax=Natronoflexus pectinivorans TaxID=682526 RepID=A0A4R2GNV0_9BACT|nr:flotillin family protein [Natronoflexus pectinivorans]TCO10995.1 SPFH domain/Band 7 family protein [Natronoflexus pectinivorans]